MTTLTSLPHKPHSHTSGAIASTPPLNPHPMTHAEIQSLTDSGHDLTAKVALAIIAAANVGPTALEMSVDNVTLGMIARTLGMVTSYAPATQWQAFSVYELRLTFLEVNAVIYARVPR